MKVLLRVASIAVAFVSLCAYGDGDHRAAECKKSKSRTEILEIAKARADKDGSKVTVLKVNAFMRKKKWHVTLYLKPNAPGNYVTLEISTCGEILHYAEGL